MPAQSESSSLITQNVKDAVISFLRDEGMSLLGVAAARELSSTPRGFSPSALLRGAKSVVCFGTPIPRGLIYAQRDNLDRYWRYCNIQYRTLDAVSNRLCLFLEEKNGSAVPVYSCFPWKTVDREFWGHLPLVYWAEEAGLGQLAKCGLLITPQYGTRVLLAGLIATQELEPDKKLTQNLCPSECFKCIDACPAQAIERTGKVDHNRCIRHSSSNPLLRLVLDNQKISKPYSFETLLNTIAVDDHGTYLCTECLKVCPFNSK